MSRSITEEEHVAIICRILGDESEQTKLAAAKTVGHDPRWGAVLVFWQVTANTKHTEELAAKLGYLNIV